MSNTERANRAQRALTAYAPDNDEDNLRDLICDLRHLADHTGLDWNDQLRVAMDNYRAELEEDGTDTDQAKRDCKCWKCQEPLWTDEVASPADEEPLCGSCFYDQEFEAGHLALRENTLALLTLTENLIDQLASLRVLMDGPVADRSHIKALCQLDEVDTTAEQIHSIHVQEGI